MQEEATNQIEERVEDEGEVVELDVPESDDSDSDEAIEDVSAEEEQKASKEDELEDYSKSVQKRIATLTKKMREQERAAQSAYEYAKNLQAENQTLKTSASQLNQSYFGEAESRLKSQRAQANAVLKQAYQDQDWDKVTKAQEILDKITVEESKLANNRVKIQQPEPSYQNYNPQQFQQFQQPQAAPEPAAFNIHRKLIEEEGFDPSDSMYYDEIDKRIRAEFPHKFSGEKTKGKMQQTVAPAVRADGSGRKRQVRLTKSEVEMARRLNVPVQEYAKYIKR
jgi:hypothetical protein